MQLDFTSQQNILKAIKASDTIIIITGQPAEGEKRNQSSFINGKSEALFKDLLIVAQSNPQLSPVIAAVGKAIDPLVLRLYTLSKEFSQKVAILVLAQDAEKAVEIIKAQLEIMQLAELAQELTAKSLFEISTAIPAMLMAVRLGSAESQ